MDAGFMDRLVARDRHPRDQRAPPQRHAFAETLTRKVYAELDSLLAQRKAMYEEMRIPDRNPIDPDRARGIMKALGELAGAAPDAFRADYLK